MKRIERVRLASDLPVAEVPPPKPFQPTDALIARAYETRRSSFQRL